jgi:hypothetical protein
MSDEQLTICTCPPDVRDLPPGQHNADCLLFRRTIRQQVKARMAEADPRRAEGKRLPRERKPL